MKIYKDRVQNVKISNLQSLVESDTFVLFVDVEVYREPHWWLGNFEYVSGDIVAESKDKTELEELAKNYKTITFITSPEEINKPSIYIGDIFA